MVTFADVLIVAGMFVLRIGVPIAVIFGLAYLLKRLDRRWEAEARAGQILSQETPVTAPPAAQPRPVRRPGVDVPGPQLPFDPGLIRGPQPGLAAASARHCWDVKGCDPAEREQCPAYLHSDRPCWQARTQAEKQMSEACFDCRIYKDYPRI